MPNWKMTLSSAPLPVPMLSRGFAFIGISFLLITGVAFRPFHRIEDADGQRNVLGYLHHLSRQLNRRGKDSPAGCF